MQLERSMSTTIESSDTAILDLLRQQNSIGVGELADAMNVTATAVRQRLNRLMGQGLIERHTVRQGRGRPSHQYALTEQGRRKTGANFTDLAMTLWRELRAIPDMEVRRGLLKRIAQGMASGYAGKVQGATAETRMRQVAELFGTRGVAFDVDASGSSPVLNARACPYPDLAEQDRGICAMEKMLFSELLEQDVKLSDCRLDGGDCCSFELAQIEPIASDSKA